MFEIAPLNPLRFFNSQTKSFDTTPGVEQNNIYQDQISFIQKWLKSDTPKLQILSDWVFTFKIKDCITEEVILIVDPVVVPTAIVGYTFLVYEVALDFSTLEGKYYAAINYNNGTDDIELFSEPFEVAEEFPGTILAECTNSENNFSVVFDTGIVFKLRFDGVIADFNPESVDTIYVDQIQNTTKLDSMPYRAFKLYVGDAKGIPNWVLDKINRLFSCDQIILKDGILDTNFEKKEGAKWEIIRADEYIFTGAQLEIVPVENRFSLRFKTLLGNDTGNGTIKMIQKVDNHSDISAGLAIPGKFKDKTLLEKICIVKTGAAFNLLVGTTNGGSEIGAFSIVDTVTTLNINYLFIADAILYLTGISSTSFLSIIYKQLDESTTPLSPGGGSAAKGTTVIYDPVDEAELDINFNITTGLGREGTGWEGWAIADGRNGTKDRSGMFALGYKYGEYEIGATGGAKEVTLTIAQMPEHSHNYRTAVGEAYKRGNTGTRFFDNNRAAITDKTGGNQPHDNMPPYLVSLYVTKII